MTATVPPTGPAATIAAIAHDIEAVRKHLAHVKAHKPRNRTQARARQAAINSACGRIDHLTAQLTAAIERANQ